MKTFVMSDIQKLAFSASNGISVEGYTKESMNSAVREAVKDACGGEWNYYKFMENRYKVFALMAEILPVAMNANLAGKFEGFANFKDTAIGDKPYFTVEDDTTYPVVTVSRGNGDIERNKIVDRKFTIATVDKAIKFYDDMSNFMAGKMDLGRLTEKASTAMSNYVGELISDTIYGSYAAIDTEFKATGAYDAATLASIVEYVKASNSAEKTTIYGTTTALGNIADAFGYSDGAKDRANSLGYYGNFRESNMIALPQGFRAGTQTLAVNTSFVIVLPSDAPIVNVLFEGDALVDMKDGMNRNDMQPEVFFSRRIGAAALTVPEGKFGMYKFV